MDIESTKMKFLSEELEEVMIKSELPEYDSVEESYITETRNKLMNLINGDIHELQEYETDSLQLFTVKLETLHRCYQCQEEFETAESLRYHIGAYTRKNLIIPHVKGSNVTSKSCDFQNHKLNESQDEYNRLALIDANKKRFVCEFCLRSFKTMSSLKIHIKNKHKLNVRIYKCENCGKMCKTAASLKNHMRVHTNGKPYECDICKKELKYWQSLKLHVQAHMEGGRPYKCSICSMSFARDYYLSMHMVTHTEEKKFACEVCQQAFRRKDVLKSHMLVHRDQKSFVCDVCNKCFAKSTYLREHTKIHRDKKSYVCNVCGKGFIYAFYLSTHIRTHTGEKPYECDICQKRFARRFSVTKHKRIHTKVPKTKKTADRKTKKRKTTCDKDSNNTSADKRRETIINLEDQEIANANELHDQVDLIEFADVKIEFID